MISLDFFLWKIVPAALFLFTNFISPTLSLTSYEYDLRIENGFGWCTSGLNQLVTGTIDSIECWDKCVELYGDILYAVDFWSNDNSCFCQDNCICRADSGEETATLITRADTYLPHACDYEGVSYSYTLAPYVGVGWCRSGLDAHAGLYSEATECWKACFDTYGIDLVAIDFWSDDGSCYCQSDCLCRADSDDDTVVLIVKAQEVEQDPGICNPYQYSYSLERITDNGFCHSEISTYFGDGYGNAWTCWDDCIFAFDYYGIFLAASNFDPTKGDCFCQEDCVCMNGDPSNDIEVVMRSEVDVPIACAYDGSYSYSLVTDFGSQWCISSLNFEIGAYTDAAKCWDACFEKYADELVAIDYWPDDNSCYCQNECPCFTHAAHDEGTLIYRPDVMKEEPYACNPYTSYSYSLEHYRGLGYCSDTSGSPGLKRFTDFSWTVWDCWNACVEESENVVAALFFFGACYCQPNQCVCREATGYDTMHMAVRSTLNMPIDCDYDGGSDEYELEAYFGFGGCRSGLNAFVGTYGDAGECWRACADEFGQELVAVDFWSRDNSCYCQDDCTCRAHAEDDSVTLLIRADVAIPLKCDDGGAPTPAPTASDAVTAVVDVAFHAAACGSLNGMDLALAVSAQLQGVALAVEGFRMGDGGAPGGGVRVDSFTCVDNEEPWRRRRRRRRRRRLEDGQPFSPFDEDADATTPRRSLLASSEGQVEVTRALSETGAATAQAFEDLIQTALTEAMLDGSFAEAIAAQCSPGCANVAVYRVGTTLKREYPTLAPSSSPAPTSARKSGGSGEAAAASASAAVIGVICACVGVLALAGVVLCFKKREKKMDGAGFEDGQSEVEVNTDDRGGGKDEPTLTSSPLICQMDL